MPAEQRVRENGWKLGSNPAQAPVIDKQVNVRVFMQGLLYAMVDKAVTEASAATGL